MHVKTCYMCLEGYVSYHGYSCRCVGIYYQKQDWILDLYSNPAPKPPKMAFLGTLAPKVWKCIEKWEKRAKSTLSHTFNSNDNNH